MKRIVQTEVINAVLLFVSSLLPNVFASNNSVSIQEVLNVINTVMPSEWKIHKIDYENKPYWSFSNDKCVLLEVYGQRMAGADHYDTRGEKKVFITRRYVSNESRSIWITTENFNPDWTILNRLKNRLNKTPVPYPEKLAVINGLTIYGEDRFNVVLKKNEDIAKDSPPGANRAEPVKIENGGSWPTWIEDIRKGLSAINRQVSLQGVEKGSRLCLTLDSSWVN